MFKTLHHIALICSNYEVSKDFYVNKLGFSIIRETNRTERNSYKLDLKLGALQLELFSFPNPPKRTSFPEAAGLRHISFGVENIESTRQELIQKGIVVEEIRTDLLTAKKFTFFQDPDGQPLEIYEI